MKYYWVCTSYSPETFLFYIKNTRPCSIVTFYFEDGGGLPLDDQMKSAIIMLAPVNIKGTDSPEKELKPKSTVRQSADIKIAK